jgi:putative endonuclease
MVWSDGFTGWFRRDEPEHLARGRLGERAAKRYLKKAGLKFLYANFKGEQGEIDLIFRDREILVFVEVKTRSSEAWRRPAAAVTPDKQRRVAATARDYLRFLERSDIPVRYDIVEVLLEEGRVKEIRHQPNAFAPARKSR